MKFLKDIVIILLSFAAIISLSFLSGRKYQYDYTRDELLKKGVYIIHIGDSLWGVCGVMIKGLNTGKEHYYTFDVEGHNLDPMQKYMQSGKSIREGK